jgi:SnoaL-like domain
MTTSVRELVADYIQSVGDGRLDHVAELLHPDLDFGGATAVELHEAGPYVAALERLSPIIERNDIRDIVVDGDRAVVVYDFVTNTEVGPVLTAESLVIEDGKIRSITLLFDWRRWPEVLAELGRRSAQPVAAADA